MSPTYSVCKNHGYLTGEVYVCPECGEKTEVYSRITGYYRPIQNWNDGKTQEYMDRREYDIMVSKLTHDGPIKKIGYEEPSEVAENAPAPQVAEAEQKVENRAEVPTMYVKDHCPKCKGAEQRFKLANVEYSEVNCSENMDVARELNIQQTPTIIDPDGTRYEGANAAAEWLKAHNA